MGDQSHETWWMGDLDMDVGCMSDSHVISRWHI